MFNTIAVAIILLDGWGMIGIWTDKFGFHKAWEVWVSRISDVLHSVANRPICPGLPSILRTLHLPLVQLLPDHDLGSHPPRP